MKQKKSAVSENDKKRREAIALAALECFLKFGYNKTSLDDIAKAASLSRPLLYLKFKNKEEIFKAVFEHVIADGYQMAEEAVVTRQSKKAALMAVYEALVLRGWDKVMGHPMSAEFYGACEQIFPESCEKLEKVLFKHVTTLLGDKESAEVFAHAATGLQTDLPPTKTLRKRLEILIEKFI